MLILLAGAVPWLAAADGPQPTAKEAVGRDVQDLIFFGKDGPLLLRLHVWVDGKPFRDAFETAWQDYLAHLFRYLDRDGDGFLSPQEAERAPAPTLLLPGGGADDPGSPVHVAFNFRVLDTNGDGKVSLEELTAYYRDYGGGAFHALFQPGRSSPGDSLDDALFEHLDRNQDGKLTREELAAAPALLRLDADGDELLSPQELLGQFLRPGSPPAPAARQEPAFFLVSADGQVDSGKVAQFAQRPPDVELIVRFGQTAPGQAPLEVFNPGGKAGPLAAAVHPTPDGLAIHVGKTLIEVCRNDGRLQAIPASWQFYRDQLAAADTDGRGFVDRNSARRNRFLADWFEVIDRNGRGKVGEKELLAYLDEVQDRLARALACRPALLASGEGRGLFDLLDTNRDGRLSLRELRDAPQVIGRLGRDAAGFITRDDIPRSYRLAFSLGRPSLNRHGGNTVVVVAPAREPQGVGPLWFRKMDRNHDGDVSRQEFLGTPEEFARLDTDGDGLISVEEAERADALLRRGAGKK